MNILEVIETIHQLQRDGIVECCAIGGAVAATFYLEPVATLDVHVFVTFQRKPESALISLSPIFEYLQARGYTLQGEYILIGGWPVQFLPPTSPLVDEALREAAVRDVEGIPAPVFTAEHLAAIALQTGRAKNKLRLLQFVEAGVLDSDRFQAILARHSLVDAWHKFERQYLQDTP